MVSSSKRLSPVGQAQVKMEVATLVRQMSEQLCPTLSQPWSNDAAEQMVIMVIDTRYTMRDAFRKLLN